MTSLSSVNVTLAYDADPIVVDLSVEIPDGEITTIIGPNGCGKSTLLRAMARLMRPKSGAVVLDGQLIHQAPTREVARRLGLLSQQMSAPDGITVEDLTRRGRYPHQAFLQSPTAHDAEAVTQALELAGMTSLRKRPVDELSGGQRQRAWIAMALAQETPLLLLDEPTTYLDLAHQIEVLDLIERLNREEARTIVMVLHDVNEAARVSHNLIAMKAGSIVRKGAPETIVEPELLQDLYGVGCDVYPHPQHGHAICVPRGAVRPAHATRPNVVAAKGPGVDVEKLQVSYGPIPILHDLSVELPAGAVTAIIGPNACGKSTFLRCCASLIKPRGGSACIDCKDVRSGSRRAFARQLSLLSQGPKTPPGLLVEDFVAFGRTPHQGLFRQWSQEDELAVNHALDRCDLTGIRHREVESLSGGQRQRAWFAMALAQDTPVLLLDEPTTFLDLGAQIDLLDLVVELNRTEGRTVAMILHDLNLAARYADWLIAMKDGRIVAEGTPAEIVTPTLLRDVFNVEAEIIIDPISGTPLILPEPMAGKQLPELQALAG
jgi:iron complex transport system ATP-binding protein